MSFSKYINNLRLEYAAKMLKNHPDYTVDTIAQECGMSTQSLYRLFSGKYGVTPTDFQVGYNILIIRILLRISEKMRDSK